MNRRIGRLKRAGASIGLPLKNKRVGVQFSPTRTADVGTFFAKVDRRMATRRRRCGSLAVVEIKGLADEGDVDISSPVVTSLLRNVFDAVERDVALCWSSGRLLVLTPRAAMSRRTLRTVWRTIATFSGKPGEGPKHMTPAIGYADLRCASDVGSLWDMAEDALAVAESSLETEPFRHHQKLQVEPKTRSFSFADVWRRVPQGFALSTQLMLSILLGFGAPFVLYATCDALGTDISGPIYLGVVAVLVLTATTIWIEGFLALKPTEPPLTPGSPAPVATIIIPAYLPNEADTIVETLQAFLRLEYQNKVQVIIAYNAPAPHLPVEDDLRAIASAQPSDGRFLIEPIRVAGSTSKAQNVNAVIGRVRGDFVGIFDADHHPRPDSVERAWRWLSNGWDIVQGRCSIRNGGDSWVSRMVAVEFEQIYAVSHPGRARFHGFGIFGGSNGFWRTKVLHETRMRHAMLTEDIDSSIRAVEAGYRIAGDRDLISEELAPTGLNQLLNQRLRWAQGWFQVSFRRVVPALFSRRVTLRQKLGLLHLLVWRELFPWYSIQVVPIMFYWIWVYGWAHIQWAVPIFLFTTVYTWSTGPGQIILAYVLAQKSMRARPLWFIEYLIVSTLFYSPFKDTLSRIAHIKEAMRERAWRVTPRARTYSNPVPQFASFAITMLLSVTLLTGAAAAKAPTDSKPSGFSVSNIALMLGGEAGMIHRAREAAKLGRNAEAARAFAEAIAALPARRPELLREYADSLANAGQNAQAAPLYRELLASPSLARAEERVDVQRRLATSLSRSRQFSAALAVYSDMLQRSPGDADIAIRRAQMLSMLGRHDEAVAALDRIRPDQWSARALGNIGDEILVTAARDAAKAGRNAPSAALFLRAIEHNAALRPSLLQEYADQLTYSSRASAAIPLYREVIAKRGSVDTIRRAQRGLSLALTWTKSPAQAVGAWQVYLKQAPGDVDAHLHQAQALATLHQSAKALEIYKAVALRDPGNMTARRGMLDETINLARGAARENRHGDATVLFARAVQLDGRKRRDILREYADQISFGGNPRDAVAVYREVLAGDALAPSDRKRALIALADAYDWSGQQDAAAVAYADLAKTYADDADLQWISLVFAARKAAQSDQNQESVELFARAIELFPTNRDAVLREYADQLSFAGKAAAAIPIFQEVLGLAKLSAADRRAARIGLAQAEAWSGRYAEAKIQYESLVREFPADEDLRWSAIVVSARDAAQRNLNKESANLFADAIKIAPQKATTIQVEYADQLSYTGRAYRAIPLYVDFLSKPSRDEADRWSAKKALAQAYAWSNRLPEAKAAYEELVIKYPADTALACDLLVVQARQAAIADRNDEAATLYGKAIKLVPARRIALLKDYADKLTFSGQAKAGIALYRELLTLPRTAVDNRNDRLALALALAWDKQTDLALREYQELSLDNSEDDEAANGVARMLSWKGRQAAAGVTYRHILARSPDNPEAQRGLAQVEDWQGHHRVAQRILAKRIKSDPTDLEARRLLAQSELWMGRPDKALAELALAAAPPPKAPRNTRLAKSSAPMPRPAIVPVSLTTPSGGN